MRTYLLGLRSSRARPVRHGNLPLPQQVFQKGNVRLGVISGLCHGEKGGSKGGGEGGANRKGGRVVGVSTLGALSIRSFHPIASHSRKVRTVLPALGTGSRAAEPSCDEDRRDRWEPMSRDDRGRACAVRSSASSALSCAFEICRPSIVICASRVSCSKWSRSSLVRASSAASVGSARSVVSAIYAWTGGGATEIDGSGEAADTSPWQRIAPTFSPQTRTRSSSSAVSGDSSPDCRS